MRLFKENYYFLHGKNEYRFYFEQNDLGIFIWIDDNKELTSFQIDYQNRISFHFNRPNKIGIAGINNEPISGGITESVDNDTKEFMKSELLQIHSDDFTGIVGIIHGIVDGKKNIDFKIPEMEWTKLLSTKIIDCREKNNH